ncbi:helix-turn-helix domain-containing protein [Rhodococcus tibetensis]|uniref:Helix-turn-helix domain-containing protein n=1 Tax=Rhodococcus tibetensis TaxID=2965064 RepID=A0ABT1QDT5_9NOCA|nr:helix-turn-helix domain-containing protein [Rhodococcus sp. FXJ9.536]MCQ4120441.1 helix-turn-helix domain-containing protein [Rhodococcus sp. FXJ9.536]
MSRPLVQRLAPDVVLLTGPAVEAVRFAVAVALAARRRNGLPVPAHLAVIAAELAAGGQTDAKALVNSNTRSQTTRWITTEEAAKMLGCSNRQARRKAPALGGQLHAGRWMLDHQAVTEHLEGRKAA